MSIINYNKGHAMDYEIDKNVWATCEICKKSISEIKKEIGGNGIYKSQAFLKHLDMHNVNRAEYFSKYCERPICECGICNKKTGISYRGAKLLWRRLACGRNKGVREWAVKAKTGRKGKHNPMYGKKPWNKGKTKKDNIAIFNMSENRKGSKVSNESKAKMSIAALKRKVHGHTGFKHSKETKDKIRQKTLQQYNNGLFQRSETKPQLMMQKILEELNIKYRCEEQLYFFSMDIYLIDYNIYIEVDGDYFHTNPDKYPDGPQNKMQKRNLYNDYKKNKYCFENKIKLLRFWEIDILSNPEQVKKGINYALGKNYTSKIFRHQTYERYSSSE